MGERLHRLSVVNIGPNPHDTVAEVGEPVRTVAVAPLDPEPALADEVGELVPQAGWRLAGQQHWSWRFGRRRPVHLSDVEDRHRLDADDLLTVPLPPHLVQEWFAVLVRERDAAGDRPEDPDGLLATAYLIALCLPRPVARDSGRIRRSGA